MNKWLRLAARIANANRTEGKNFALGALLVKGGSIISTGFNKKKTDPIIRILCEKNKYDTHKFRTWMHAELDCINRIPYERTKGGVLFVARITHDLLLANAKPCHICQREIMNAGIKRVHYTLNERSEVILYLDENNEKNEEFLIDASSYPQRNASWQREVFSIECH